MIPLNDPEHAISLPKFTDAIGVVQLPEDRKRNILAIGSLIDEILAYSLALQIALHDNTFSSTYPECAVFCLLCAPPPTMIPEENRIRWKEIRRGAATFLEHYRSDAKPKFLSTVPAMQWAW